MSSRIQSLGVVGAGVIGLSTAIVAQRRGHAVTLYADSPLLETTSAKAAASFKPHEVVMNDLALTMLTQSWEHFDRLAQHNGLPSGVRLHTHWEASSSPVVHQPYLDVMKDLAVFEHPHVPGGYQSGRRYTTFFIDTPVYLPWLLREFMQSGGAFVHLQRRYEDLEELSTLPHEIIFNCTGLGSRKLCNDSSLYPIKGQVAIVAPQPQMDWSISADGFYVYPRSTDTVLGGTTEHHVETTTNDWVALSLLVRANRRILPHLTDASIVRGIAGLRPYRTQTIRVEAETVRDRRIVHNYGHGGAGVSLSWGSAERALEVACLA